LQIPNNMFPLTPRLTTQISCLLPAAPSRRLLALVPKLEEVTPAFPEAGVTDSTRQYADDETFGDIPGKKGENTLRVGFLNIGGLPLESKKIKNDLLRRGISALECDVFGIAEINTDWRLITEDNQLHSRTKGWWEALHISQAHNCVIPPVDRRQWRGTALFTLNKASHRVISKGKDDTKLGRWCWTRFRGKNNNTLRIFLAYGPNLPTGPLLVHSQHRSVFLAQKDNRDPRVAFPQDLSSAIKEAKAEGDQIILLMDGNMDMRNSALSCILNSLQMTEVILRRHGNDGPSTFHRNNTNTPIDGIWTSSGIRVKQCGYLPYDLILPGADYRCLWMDITYKNAFGHNMPAIPRPNTRRLHCCDP
jgi:hypothetical protein